MNILITGAAGFIGANLSMALLKNGVGDSIMGVDRIDDYYDVSLKHWRLQRIEEVAGQSGSSWTFRKCDISDRAAVDAVFAGFRPDIVVNLAAQAGVRYSIQAPEEYIVSNIVGFFNILEACRHSRDGGRTGVRHLVYASSSSVYGRSQDVPFSTEDRTDSPVSLYAATKKADEVLAYSYSELYGIPATGLRFFTVYGPAGRPDMAYFKFADRLVSGGKIQVYNEGRCLRDFTYIDDIVKAVILVMGKAPQSGVRENGAAEPPHRLYNVGNSSPVRLLDFINILQEELVAAGVLPDDFDPQAHMEFLPMQPGDVPVTFADTSAIERDFGFSPSTDLRYGLRQFVLWYKDFIGNRNGNCR